MLDTRFAGNGAPAVDPLGGLLDVSSAPVTFGYYEENAADAEIIARCHEPRKGPVGWWDRHRRIRLAVGMVLVVNLGLLPAVQNGILTALSHVA
ncbi:hypothetical protein [Nocardia transvalensis]|uniref:hypothetical protein n=1 Tax=Nocardia transvalensis TaxID=37333 RepID=UPI001892FB32|nr:hypothetical protein [Nocardia transvalensis]MBF6331972.1 hypothetical protein [Nocardia transvalensis]